MNGKKGLSRIMSALLAAMSFVGQASADTKKETKKPDHAAAVLRDRKNRGRDKGGNKRHDKGGNKRGEKLGLSSSESGVVGLIKEYPKTSAGLGLAGLSAIGCGYIGYKIYNNELNSIYRKMFSKQNCKDFLDFSWCDVGYNSKLKIFIFSKSVEVDKLKKVYAGFAMTADFIDSFSADHDSNCEEMLRYFLRLWILSYSCERMVKVHPEWSYLLNDGDKLSVTQLGYSGLRVFAGRSIERFPENSKEFRDLTEIYEWAEVFARFESEYIVPLLKYVKGYAEQNKISIAERIGSLVDRCKKARADKGPH